MLWNIVFEFFVKYIFGGILYEDNGDIVSYTAKLGAFFGGNDYYLANTKNFSYITLSGYGVCMGNYFSLIATIISMVVIVILCCLLIKKIYNICAHIIG